MTARLPKRLRDRSRVHADFEAAMNSGAPIVDNAGALHPMGHLEYDGPRCTGCDAVVDDDRDLWGGLCGDCSGGAA